MKLTPRSLFIPVTILLVVGGGLMGWRQQAPLRQWKLIRPTAPALVGVSAPGLDTRLAVLIERMHSWPIDRAALAEFTLVCHANGLLSEAMRGYQALITVEPTETRWPHLLAGILTDYGRMEEALPWLKLTTQLAPTATISWQRLGDALLKSNQTAEAAAAFTAVLHLKPKDVHGLFGLARCELQAGRLTAARSRLQEAVLADPDFPGAQSLLATVFDRLGNPDAAQAARLRVRGDGNYTATADPWAVDLGTYCHNPYTLLVAASGRAADHRPHDALPLLKRALALSPNDARLHRQLGNTLSLLGDPSGARPHLEQALALDATNEKIRTDLIGLLKSLADIPAADRYVQEGLATNPGSAAFLFEAGLIAVRQRRFDEAIACFEMVWRRHPELSGAPSELVTVYFATDQIEAGQALLEKLAMDFPDDPAVLALLVRRGITTRDPRTGKWLRRALAAGKSPANLAELRQAYLTEFGLQP